MNEKIRALYMPQTTTKATVVLLLNFGSIIVLLVFSESVHSLMVSIFCALLFTSRLKCINNIIHECYHQSFSNNKKYNHGVGRILCLIILTDYISYKEEHQSHHKYLGDYNMDLDFKARKSLRHNEPFTWQKIFKDIFKLKFIYFYLPRINVKNRDQATSVFFYTFLFGICMQKSYYSALLVLILSNILWMPLLKYFIDIVDHGGLYNEEADEIYKSRNFIIQNTLVRELIFPRNDCYHLVHHLYPYLPVNNLSQAHQLLLEDNQYREIRHDWNIRCGFKRNNFPFNSKDHCYG
jgi:fatty acid desaturase